MYNYIRKIWEELNNNCYERKIGKPHNIHQEKLHRVQNEKSFFFKECEVKIQFSKVNCIPSQLRNSEKKPLVANRRTTMTQLPTDGAPSFPSVSIEVVDIEILTVFRSSRKNIPDLNIPTAQKLTRVGNLRSRSS